MKIFLSGGMTNLSEEEAMQWREDIINRSKYYPSLNKIINPPAFFSVKNPIQDYQMEAMRFDLHHLLTSDLIIVNFNSPNSIGTAQELALAYYNHIPIIGLKEENAPELHPWYIEECTKIFEYNSDNYYDTIDTVLYYISTYYNI